MNNIEASFILVAFIFLLSGCCGFYYIHCCNLKKKDTYEIIV